jgi:hypothetical protein
LAAPVTRAILDVAAIYAGMLLDPLELASSHQAPASMAAPLVRLHGPQNT